MIRLLMIILILAMATSAHGGALFVPSQLGDLDDVGTLTDTKWCSFTTAGGLQCTENEPVMTESDPKVGTLTNTKWCTSDGSQVICNTTAPVEMSYPGAGVPVSTGSAWDTSLSTDGTGDCTAGAVCLGGHDHSSITGNAATATALAANGANCAVGQAPLGVDASGAVEGCWTPVAFAANVLNYNVSGSSTTTTGTIADTSDQLTVASATSFSVGQGIRINGAGAACDAGTCLITSITDISGTTFTLADAASTATCAGGGCVVMHDDTAAIQAMIDSSGNYNMYYPAGTYRITSTLQVVGGQHYRAFVGIGSSSIISTDQNITMLSLGDYVWDGLTDDWTSGDFNYYGTVRDMYFYNNAPSNTTAYGIALRGATRAYINNARIVGVKDGIVSYNYNSWTTIDKVQVEKGQGATEPDNAIRLFAPSYSINHHSTGLTLSNIFGGNVKNAIVYATGCTFGDLFVSNINGTGIASGGNGTGGGAHGAVYFKADGLCGDGDHYESRINVSNLMMDGTADAVLKLDGTSWVFASNLSKGGDVATYTSSANLPATAGWVNMIFSPETAYFDLYSDTFNVLGTSKTYGESHVIGAEAGNASLILDADEGDDDADTWFIKSLASGNNLSFINHETERMSLTSAGVLGITTVSGGSAVDSTLTLQGSSHANPTTDAIIFKTNAAEAGRIDNTGNWTIGGGVATTDYTLTFNGETNDGLITWMEDEDYLKISDDVVLLDNEELYLGTGLDFELFHDGTNSYIQNNTGDTIIENDASNEDIIFKVNDGGVDTEVARFTGSDGGLKLSIGDIYPASDSTTAIQINKANNSTNVVTVDTTNARVGIGNIAPDWPLVLSTITNYGVFANDVYSDSVAHAPYFSFRKSTGTTVGTPAATVDTDVLGIFSANGVNSSTPAFKTAAKITFIQNGTTGASWVPADIFFSTSDGTAASAERFRIDKSGQLIIAATGSSGGNTNLCWDNSGSSIWGGCTSLREYKTNILPLPYGLDTVMQLNPVVFDWKSSGQHDLGFIAEEVNEVSPLLAEYSDGKLSGVKYREMVAVLVNAIKELKAEIDELKSMIKEQP